MLCHLVGGYFAQRKGIKQYSTWGRIVRHDGGIRDRGRVVRCLLLALRGGHGLLLHRGGGNDLCRRRGCGRRLGRLLLAATHRRLLYGGNRCHRGLGCHTTCRIHGRCNRLGHGCGRGVHGCGGGFRSRGRRGDLRLKLVVVSAPPNGPQERALRGRRRNGKGHCGEQELAAVDAHGVCGFWLCGWKGRKGT